jgi:peptidoglycan/LPS O-acetylase OafA/YrhL
MNNSKAPSSSNWVNGLDSIRFVLAMMVFLSHLENSVAIYLKSLGIGWLKWVGIAINHLYLGPGAVTAFFIISGFVIHYPVKERPLEVKSFLIRRWARISLPLLVVAAFAWPFDRFYLIPIWSLYCELIYYTIYPLLRKLKISWATQFGFSFVLAIVVIIVGDNGEIRSLFARADEGYTGSYAALGDLLTWIIGLPCWLLGVIIADNIDSIQHRVSTVRITIIRGLILLMAMLIVGLKAHYFVSYIVTLNFYAIPLAYWITQEIIYFRHKQPIRWLEYGGKFSYSLYLLHGISVSIIVLFIDLSIRTYFVYVLITVLFSYLFFKAVEEPAHQLSKYLSKLRKPRPLPN